MIPPLGPSISILPRFLFISSATYMCKRGLDLVVGFEAFIHPLDRGARGQRVSVVLAEAGTLYCTVRIVTTAAGADESGVIDGG